MKAIDYVKAIGVALATLVFAMAASFPMVAVYAYLIEPGHDQAFYTEAAQWIAPWSSYILGPITFFALNYLLAKRSPDRNPLLFAAMTILGYLVIDISMLPALGVELSSYLTIGFVFWIAVKLAGALFGAHLGALHAGDSGISDGAT